MSGEATFKLTVLRWEERPGSNEIRADRQVSAVPLRVPIQVSASCDGCGHQWEGRVGRDGFRDEVRGLVVTCPECKRTGLVAGREYGA